LCKRRIKKVNRITKRAENRLTRLGGALLKDEKWRTRSCFVEESLLRKQRLWTLVLVAGGVGLIILVIVLWNSRRQQPENLHISNEQWREDLRYLARELPRRHANAFHFTPRDTFEKAVAELDLRLAHANGDEAWVGLQRLVSLVGDGHTLLRTPADAARFEMQIARFGSDYRVIAIDPVWKNAIGARAIKIGDVPVERVAELAHDLYARDENPPSAESFVESVLTTWARNYSG
jgi:hypothetical protein